MHFANGETGATMHNRLPVLFHRATTRRASSATSASIPTREIFFYTRAGLLGGAGRGRLRGRELPGRRDHRLEPLVGARLARHGHAEPRRRRRLRLRDRHRRLLRRPHPGHHQGAVHPLGRVGGALARSSGCTARSTPAPTRRGATTPRPCASTTRCRGCTCARAPLILRLWREARAHRASRSRGRCGSPTRGDAEAARAGPGVAARAGRAGRAGRRGGRDVARACTSRAAAGSSPRPAARYRRAAIGEVEAPLGRLPYFFRCGTNPFAEAAGRRGCLARRSPIGPRNIGRVRLGYSRARLLRLRVKPIRRTRRSFRYCVKGSRGRVTAVFGRRGRVVLVATTAPAHGNRGVRPGGRARRLRAAYPRHRPLGRGLHRSLAAQSTAGRAAPRPGALPRRRGPAAAAKAAGAACGAQARRSLTRSADRVCARRPANRCCGAARRLSRRGWLRARPRPSGLASADSPRPRSFSWGSRQPPRSRTTIATPLPFRAASSSRVPSPKPQPCSIEFPHASLHATRIS